MSERSPSPELEAVIGLEIHVQLLTRQKLFCADSCRFGDAPNRHVCPVCLGLPGALPVPNPEAVELAVRAALAFGCTVHEHSLWARKHYFYPDLPKGYQITQLDRPLATGGRFDVQDDEEGDRVAVRIRRVHMEEDAGKSIHDRFRGATAVDLNRAGTPLVEMVTEPDLRTPAQVRRWLTGLKQTLEYLEVSDCNMEEGSLRVDANVSVRPTGTSRLGTKTELKNMNSFSGVQRALAAEIDRQREWVTGGRDVRQQTLLWDEGAGKLRPMRTKEESRDYRYFPDPDLPPLRVTAERIRATRHKLPELPAARRGRFREQYELSAYDAEVLTATRPLADYYEATATQADDPKEAANWIMGPVRAAMNARGLDVADFPVTPVRLAELIGLVREERVNRQVARDVLDEMLDAAEEAGPRAVKSPAEIVEEKGLAQVSDRERIRAWIADAMAANPDEVTRFREGEERLHGFFMGEVMKRSRGKADPGRVAPMLREELEG